MTEDIWDLFPFERVDWDHGRGYLRLKGYMQAAMNPAFAGPLEKWRENLKAKITQLHECLGEYESHEWCGHCIVDSKCAQITMKVNELEEKAEKWDQYAIYDNDKKEEILVKDLITSYEKLEAIKKWHKAQIGREVDPQDIRELGEILEAEGK